MRNIPFQQEVHFRRVVLFFLCRPSVKKPKQTSSTWLTKRPSTVSKHITTYHKYFRGNSLCLEQKLPTISRHGSVAFRTARNCGSGRQPSEKYNLDFSSICQIEQFLKILSLQSTKNRCRRGTDLYRFSLGRCPSPGPNRSGPGRHGGAAAPGRGVCARVVQYTDATRSRRSPSTGC